jgi:hypothetical protein
LAAHLVNDAWRGDFEAAAVVSNDTDLVEPIRIVTQERGLPVFLLCPKQQRAAPQLAAVASHVRYLNKNMLKIAQFPDDIPRVGKAPIVKPDTW